MPKKHTADAPEQHQYPSPTVRLEQTDMPADHALQQLQEQNLSMFANMQAMMEEMQAAHLRQMQELQADMQAQMLHLQQQITGAHGMVHSVGKPSSTETSKDAIKEAAILTADQLKDEAEETAVKRMPTLTLGEYSGTKYDGSPDKFSEWDSIIRNKLTTHKVLACILDESYQGRDINGAKIKPGAFLNDLISEGCDQQSAVRAYIAQSLTGTISTKIERLKEERQAAFEVTPVEKRKGARITLTAYEIYAYVKQEANPVLAFQTREQVEALFRGTSLAPRVDRNAFDKYVADKRSQWNFLNRTGGGKDCISEHSLVAQMLGGMQKHHESARRVLADASRSAGGEFCLVQFEGAVDAQFPKDYSSSTTSTAYIASSSCSICKKMGHNADSCYFNPDQTCSKCKETGHHARVCKKKKKEDTDQNQEARKKDVEAAYIELGRAKEAELLAGKGSKVLTVGSLAAPAPYAPPVPSQSSFTKTVKLASGISVNLPEY